MLLVRGRRPWQGGRCSGVRPPTALPSRSTNHDVQSINHACMAQPRSRSPRQIAHVAAQAAAAASLTAARAGNHRRCHEETEDTPREAKGTHLRCSSNSNKPCRGCMHACFCVDKGGAPVLHSTHADHGCVNTCRRANAAGVPREELLGMAKKHRPRLMIMFKQYYGYLAITLRWQFFS